MAALEDALIGAKQELELAGKSGSEVALRVRDFRRSMTLEGTEYSHNMKGGAELCKVLFREYAALHPEWALVIDREGSPVESYQLVFTNNKSTKTKAKPILKAKR